MASYFIKYKIEDWSARDIYHDKTMIIDFDEFEKVNSTSIYKKIEENIHNNHLKYKIQDIIKL